MLQGGLDILKFSNKLSLLFGWKWSKGH